MGRFEFSYRETIRYNPERSGSEVFDNMTDAQNAFDTYLEELAYQFYSDDYSEEQSNEILSYKGDDLFEWGDRANEIYANCAINDLDEYEETMEENTLDLLKKLSAKSKEEIEFCLTALMLDGKLDFISVSNAYVSYLNEINKDKQNKLTEANLCVMESFLYNRNNKEKNNNATQRALYLLNESKQFQMAKLNEKYHYDEELGKKMSWYERNRLGK